MWAGAGAGENGRFGALGKKLGLSQGCEQTRVCIGSSTAALLVRILV